MNYRLPRLGRPAVLSDFTGRCVKCLAHHATYNAPSTAASKIIHKYTHEHIITCTCGAASHINRRGWHCQQQPSFTHDQLLTACWPVADMHVIVENISMEQITNSSTDDSQEVRGRQQTPRYHLNSQQQAGLKTIMPHHICIYFFFTPTLMTPRIRCPSLRLYRITNRG